MKKCKSRFLLVFFRMIVKKASRRLAFCIPLLFLYFLFVFFVFICLQLFMLYIYIYVYFFDLSIHLCVFDDSILT